MTNLGGHNHNSPEQNELIYTSTGTMEKQNDREMEVKRRELFKEQSEFLRRYRAQIDALDREMEVLDGSHARSSKPSWTRLKIKRERSFR